MSILHRSLAAAAVAALSSFMAPASAAVLRTPAISPLVVRPVSRTDLADLGRATAATTVSVAVTLHYRNEAELDQLVRLQGTPGSPLFHHFLTRAQFAANFAPSEADYQRVAQSLRSAGFRVRPELANRTVIDAAAPAPIAEKYFGTEIHRVAQYGHGLAYANVRAAIVPTTIASSVRTVLGLDNVVKFRSHRVPIAAQAGELVAPEAMPDASGPPLERIVGGRFAGLYPQGIKKAYKYPALIGDTGAGRAIAIVIDSDIADSDLATFWKAAKVTRTGNFYRLLVEGTNPGVNGDVGETAIDTETSSSLAPAADIYVMLIPSLSDAAIEDAYNQAVADDVFDVASSSFGGCELDDTSFAAATDAIAEQGASVGTTFTASTGDAGGFCEDATSKGKIYFEPDIVNTPASGPHFVAVGGTKLTINAQTGARVTETAWGPGGSSGGSGGGVSSYWPVPDYQSGVPGVTVVPNVTVTPPATQPNVGFAGRNLPDISLDASNTPKSYVAVYDTPDGGWTGYGGTSVANPLYAAFVAEQNQLSGSWAGYLNPSLYANYNASGYGTLFKDVTSGSSGAGWAAGPGYDQSTGIGTILDGEAYSL